MTRCCLGAPIYEVYFLIPGGMRSHVYCSDSAEQSEESNTSASLVSNLVKVEWRSVLHPPLLHGTQCSEFVTGKHVLTGMLSCKALCDG